MSSATTYMYVIPTACLRDKHEESLSQIQAYYTGTGILLW